MNLTEHIKEATELLERKELFAKDAFQWMKQRGLIEQFCKDTGWKITSGAGP